MRWAGKPGLEQAAGESPGPECFWVWGWRAAGGSGRGRRAELQRQAGAAWALLSAQRTSAVPGGRLATIAGDRRAPPRSPDLPAPHPDCSKWLLCCLFPGRQVSSLPSPPAPPPFCEGCCRSLLLALLSRLMSLAAGSRAAWSHAGPVCNADRIGVCVWGGGYMATVLALTPPKVQRQQLQRSARLDVCPFSLGNY